MGSICTHLPVLDGNNHGSTRGFWKPRDTWGAPLPPKEDQKVTSLGRAEAIQSVRAATALWWPWASEHHRGACLLWPECSGWDDPTPQESRTRSRCLLHWTSAGGKPPVLAFLKKKIQFCPCPFTVTVACAAGRIHPPARSSWRKATDASPSHLRKIKDPQ